MKKGESLIRPKRLLVLQFGLLAFVAALVGRVAYLQVVDRQFLQHQGDARYLRSVEIPAHRGMISDRNGEPLAISTPVDSLWANPQELVKARDRWPTLAKMLSLDLGKLKARLLERSDREFVFLKRHVDPSLAGEVLALGLPGVFRQREYRRYYPVGEVAAHVVGFTNIDDYGQEGIELANDDWLRGVPGNKWVLKDRLGNIVEDVASISEPVSGRNLSLSVDARLQYLAYRELKTAVQLHNAVSGTAIVLDARTGEILAMVNQPSFNPNNRLSIRSDAYRNRAVTDVFEPGSTAKPFTIAAALIARQVKPDSQIDTSPGYFKVGSATIRDSANYGRIDVTTIMQKSSNVGASKLALAVPPQKLWETFSRSGFGVSTDSGFPGEVTGLLTDYRGWNDVERATLSFGYGVSVTALQLAKAYMTIADQGRQKPVTYLHRDRAPDSESVFPPDVARQVLGMMEAVVSTKGTGTLADVMGYRIAGKTGTVQKSSAGGYSDDRYVALFAGVAPASKPRLVMVVKIDEPRNEEYYGGRVAAPVFSRVMAGALRILGIPPDDQVLRNAAAQPDGRQVAVERHLMDRVPAEGGFRYVAIQTASGVAEGGPL